MEIPYDDPTPEPDLYDTTPSPGFLRALRNQSWTAAGAISELVDNSFGAGRGNADRVVITHDTMSKTITVLDNGRGMNAIGQLFKLGDTIGRTPGDIGEYGSGGTWALLWLANVVDIWSLKNGRVSHDRVDWVAEMQATKFSPVSNEWVIATVNNTPHELLACEHGTLIKIHLNPERDRKVSDAVKKLLASTYAPGLRAGKEIVWRTLTKAKIQEEEACRSVLQSARQAGRAALRPSRPRERPGSYRTWPCRSVRWALLREVADRDRFWPSRDQDDPRMLPV